ncbi:uncharacterized protein LOC128201403 [Galleria mellonella]|uniref:Uncharacterized protein LOC128201403 n=1 Tax=Galleria mellonella TaxID=7137 RepID=A0ABM3MS28_GALME|nr:uncharacterized protein LOC128201403 [Galleria mellonella]
MAPTLPSELPVYADQVTDIGSFANLLTELSKCIVHAVADGRTVTKANKLFIIAAAEEIQKSVRNLVDIQELGAVNFQPSVENHCHLRTEEIIEGVRYELKKFRQEFNTQSIASQPPFTSYAAVASKSKFVPAPKVKSNPALIISSTEEGSTNSHEVVSKWKENISFRQLGYAPCKIQPISKGRVRVEFDSPQHCKETIERTKSIQGLAAQEEKLKRPLLILKGISKSIAREELIEIVCSQNSIQESNIRLCFLTSNRNSNLYNAVVEVSPDVRSTIVSLGRVNVEHQRVHAEDFSRFLQCFLCLQFGHTRAKCTASSLSTMAYKNHSLAVLQCNLNRSYIAQSEFNRLFIDNNFDIAIISEPYVGNSKKLTGIRGVQIIQFPRGDRHVKACIFVKNKTGCALCRTELSSPNLAVAELSLGGRKLLIASAYIEPNDDKDNTLTAIERFLSSTRGSLQLLGGDLNGWHTAWGASRNNRRGEDILDIISAEDMSVVNEGDTPTFEVIRNGLRIQSIPDVTIASSNLAHQISNWHVNLSVMVSSDHNPIQFEIGVPQCVDKNKVKSTLIYNTKQANWVGFKEDLIRYVTISGLTILQFEALDNNQIHDAVTQLIKDIHAACRRNIPKRTGNRDSNPWWNAELEALKKQCIKLHHRIHDLSVTGKPLGSTLDEYRALKAEYAKKISFASTQHFKEFCSAQGKEDVWAITNRLMKYSNNFRSPPQTVRIGQIHTDSCATTAAALLNHYFPDDGPDTSVQQRLLRAEANNIPDTDEDIPFTREEVEECLA